MKILFRNAAKNYCLLSAITAIERCTFLVSQYGPAAKDKGVNHLTFLKGDLFLHLMRTTIFTAFFFYLRRNNRWRVAHGIGPNIIPL
jgi:hypothetical protein